MRNASPHVLPRQHGRRQKRRRPLHRGPPWQELAVGQLLGSQLVGWQRHEEHQQSLTEHPGWKGVCQVGPTQPTPDQRLDNVDHATTYLA